ncbi:hypothetical protein VB773_08370 [Haloarculaceae archaeon H-GB2-1]|nr:hypothetical protein [Haloarculaceae archaeon H-GB1-1]MEA5386072.1 hypothetical protein [Haloarculaceae archaeon H-GB11]MEA5407579.1 hypothetical protein [Haloarculaceae archaeon H-GB2-1]
MVPSLRRAPVSAVVALTVGIVHAAVVVGTNLHYGYDVGPGAYPPFMILWRYGGLVVLGAVPVWFALRYRLVVPLVLVALLGGSAFYAEVTPPHATFSQLGGHTIVEDGLHLVKYAAAWYVWTVGALLVGCWEVVARRSGDVVPPSRPVPWLNEPMDQRRALAVAVVLGALHSVANVVFAWNLGLADDPLGVAWGLLGGLLLAGVPVFLLLRAGLLSPTALVAFVFVTTVHAQQAPTPADPHALYLLAWFVPLGIALVFAALEYGLGVLWRRYRPSLA